MPSPHKDLGSPIYKKQRRDRTGVEKHLSLAATDIATMVAKYNTHTCSMQNSTPMSLADFSTSIEEQGALSDLHLDVNTFMVYCYVVHDKNPYQSFIDIKMLFSFIRATHTQTSEVEYLKVLDAVADKQETISGILDNLYQKHILTTQMDYVIVEGDAKIYEILKNLKYKYGNECSWLVPYPGDWHLLKNYQLPLMKLYFDAGIIIITMNT